MPSSRRTIRTRPQAADIQAGPAWSPDGAWIACSLSLGMSFVPSGGGPPRLVGGGYEPHAVWSRGSDHLYVVRDRAGKRKWGSLAWRTGCFRPLTTLPDGLVIIGSSAYRGGREFQGDSYFL